MSANKCLAFLLLVAIQVGSFFPMALFAPVAYAAPAVRAPVLSGEAREKLLNQKKKLQSLGNPEEYKNVEIQWNNERQRPSRIRGIRKKASKDIALDTKKVMGDFSALFGTPKTSAPELRLEKNTESTLTKERHARLKQFHGDLEIVGAEIVSHVDRNGFIYQVDGAVENIPALSVKPAISPKTALAVGEKEQGKKANFQVIKKPELVVYKFASSYLLAYRYTVNYNDPVAWIGQWVYYVDANTGKKINAYSRVSNALVPAALSGAILDSEGGGTKTFTGTLDSGSGIYYLYDNTLPERRFAVYNYSSNTGIYTDAGGIAKRMTSAWGSSDQTEVSAAYNISRTLEYFNTFGFGIDDIAFSSTGQTFLPISVHYGSGLSNAFWFPGIGMYIGDGDGVNTKPLATLDVMAHEFGHAWTENTSDLVYQYEPGALNESFSDISGVNVELYAQQSAENMYPSTGSGLSDWLIGEDIMVETAALRDMRNPANTATVGSGNEQPTKYKGNNWYFGTGDNGWVHQNSSIQNFFYYLLSEGGSGNNEGILYSVDGIGLAAARLIAFETNTNFVTSTTDYKGVRQAWIDAANSLYPTDPSIAASVKAAWDAVGVTADPVVSLVTSAESFEDDTNLPIGWDTIVMTGGTMSGEVVIGNPWSVTTDTGALWNNSLVSGAIGDDGLNSVSWSGITDAGYATFYWRTSSEATFDTLDFYVDGVQKKSWSGLNPWSFYAEAVSAGGHTFTWKYSKDSSVSSWLDQVGIDAVHMVSMTGELSYGSYTGSGQYVSDGFYGTFTAPSSYEYIVSRSDGQMSKGSASGTMSFPLVGFPEWSGSIDFQYRDSDGFLSQIFTRSFFVDTVSPGAAQITAPLDGTFSNTGNITLSWESVTDSGAGLTDAPYSYYISTDSGFTNIIASGSTLSTSIDILLSDALYYAKIITQDLAGNVGVSYMVSFTVDTTAPDAPTSLVVNLGNVIDASSVTGILVSGSGGISESGSVIAFSISDGIAAPVSATGLIDASGSFHLPPMDVSGLSDGMLDYSADIVDGAGNRSFLTVGIIGKSVVPAAGSVSFPSGAYTNTGTTDIRISAEKAVSYTVSGSGIGSTLTGVLLASGSIVLPLDLSEGDGNKPIEVAFTDSANVTSSAFASIVLDTTPPTLSIASHASGAQVIGSSVLMTGSIFDINGISSAMLNTSSLLSVSNWSENVSLVGGDNAMTLTVTDVAGNTATTSVTVTRIIGISNIGSTLVSSGMRIDFDTDLLSTGSVSYGTDSGALNLSADATVSDGYHQTVVLSGLAENSLYYYTLRGTSATYSSSVSETGSFYTLKTVDIGDSSANIASTGAVVFSGSSGTGSTQFQGTGALVITSNDTPTDSVAVTLSGLVVTVVGTGTWDGIFEAPKPAALTGVTLSGSGYSLTGSVYKVGNDTASLSLSGQSAVLRIYVGTSLNGKILRVYRSDSGPVFSPIDFCSVSLGICQFQTDHFSYFAFASPSDSTPDNFSFVAQTGVNPSSNIDSNTVTLAGTNAPAAISIVWGSYSVNSLAYTSATGTVVSGDTVRIRLVSSSSYSTSTQATVTIGGVSAPFTVTTKQAPVSSGGGGGWGGGTPLDNCPKGDYSGSYYDGKCDGAKTVTGTQASSAAPSPIAPGNRSGFLASDPIIGAYDFTKEERIPQKVAAELNFFVTKLVKALDKKSGQDSVKKHAYYQAVAKYMLERAKKSNNKREKRIFSYLYIRFLVVTKIEVK